MLWTMQILEIIGDADRMKRNKQNKIIDSVINDYIYHLAPYVSTNNKAAKDFIHMNISSFLLYLHRQKFIYDFKIMCYDLTKKKNIINVQVFYKKPQTPNQIAINCEFQI